MVGLTGPAATYGGPEADLLPAQFHLSVITEIPDLTQTDPRGGFARGGASYCGPVAVSNSLVWLAHSGRAPQLKIPDSQYDLVNLLASGACLNTHPVTGTSPSALMKGLERFFAGQGEPCRIEFQGWRAHPEAYSDQVMHPRLDFVKHALVKGGGVWLNVGWYRYSHALEEYERTGGHWVTLVGYGAERDGSLNPDMLVIHDPAPRAGLMPENEFVKMTRIESGTLRGRNKGLPAAARDFFKMEGGMHVKSTADCAILDGVVVLWLGE